MSKYFLAAFLIIFGITLFGVTAIPMWFVGVVAISAAITIIAGW